MDDHKENIAKLSQKIGQITLKAHNEGRKLTGKEAGIVIEMEAAIDEERKYLPNKPVTMQSGVSLMKQSGSTSRDRSKPGFGTGPPGYG